MEVIQTSKQIDCYYGLRIAENCCHTTLQNNIPYLYKCTAGNNAPEDCFYCSDFQRRRRRVPKTNTI